MAYENGSDQWWRRHYQQYEWASFVKRNKDNPFTPHIQVYPPPPPWFKLYRSDAPGTAGRPLPPEPPAPPTQDFQMFGRMESVSFLHNAIFRREEREKEERHYCMTNDDIAAKTFCNEPYVLLSGVSYSFVVPFICTTNWVHLWTCTHPMYSQAVTGCAMHDTKRNFALQDTKNVLMLSHKWHDTGRGRSAPPQCQATLWGQSWWLSRSAITSFKITTLWLKTEPDVCLVWFGNFVKGYCYLWQADILMMMDCLLSNDVFISANDLLLAAFKQELKALNRELLFQYIDLVDILVQQPSSYARGVEAISTIFRNMHFLLNTLRCHQVSLSSSVLTSDGRLSSPSSTVGSRQCLQVVALKHYVVQQRGAHLMQLFFRRYYELQLWYLAATWISMWSCSHEQV